MRIGAIVVVLAMTALWAGNASADDPNQGGPPLYCSNKVPYSVDQDHADSQWNIWMGDCYHAYEILPRGRQPSQAACSQVWDGAQDQFRLMTRSEFMDVCVNPYPY